MFISTLPLDSFVNWPLHCLQWTVFVENEVKPTDDTFVYDKQVEFHPEAPNEWDEEEEDGVEEGVEEDAAENKTQAQPQAIEQHGTVESSPTTDNGGFGLVEEEEDAGGMSVDIEVEDDDDEFEIDEEIEEDFEFDDDDELLLWGIAAKPTTAPSLPLSSIV